MSKKQLILTSSNLLYIEGRQFWGQEKIMSRQVKVLLIPPVNEGGCTERKGRQLVERLTQGRERKTSVARERG